MMEMTALKCMFSIHGETSSRDLLRNSPWGNFETLPLCFSVDQHLKL